MARERQRYGAAGGYHREKYPHERHQATEEADGACEGRGLSVEAESKVIGHGFSARAPMGR